MRKRKQFEEFVNNKSVAIVAPSSVLDSGEDHYSKIESSDLVVRMNNGYLLSEEDEQKTTDRTEILYHCLHSERTPIHFNVLEQSTHWICSSYPDFSIFSSDIKSYSKIIERNNINFCSPNVETYNNIQNKINSRPSTGLMCIMDIFSCNPSRIDIYGATMGIQGHNKNYVGGRTEKELESLNFVHKNHNITRQAIFLLEFVDANENVQIDKKTYDILQRRRNEKNLYNC